MGLGSAQCKLQSAKQTKPNSKLKPKQKQTKTPIPRSGGWGFELLELKPPARGRNRKPLTSPVRVILRFEKEE